MISWKDRRKGATRTRNPGFRRTHTRAMPRSYELNTMVWRPRQGANEPRKTEIGSSPPPRARGTATQHHTTPPTHRASVLGKAHPKKETERKQDRKSKRISQVNAFCWKLDGTRVATCSVSNFAKSSLRVLSAPRRPALCEPQSGWSVGGCGPLLYARSKVVVRVINRLLFRRFTRGSKQSLVWVSSVCVGV